MKKQTAQKIKLTKETLRQLQSSELQEAGGGITGTSICTATTRQCCVTK